MPKPRTGCGITVLALAASLAACAGPPPNTAAATSCAPGQGAPMQIFELFFGRSLHGQGEVDDATWRMFRDAVITPNLPDGYTVLDAEGAWRAPQGTRTISERTKLLLVAMPDNAASQAAIDRVRSAYEQEFHQQSVGMVVTPGCGAF